jgi:hypothetical protein
MIEFMEFWKVLEFSGHSYGWAEARELYARYISRSESETLEDIFKNPELHTRFLNGEYSDPADSEEFFLGEM